MSDPQSIKSPVARRDFIKLAGTGLLAGGAGSVSHAQEAVSSQEKAVAARKGSGLVTQYEMETEIVIVGGGMAGVCAAIAAARNGARVVLLQDRPMLGGNASSEVRMHIVGADRHGGRKDTDSRESGILEEIRLETAFGNPQRSASWFDILLLDWVRKEPNITLLLNTFCDGVVMKNELEIQAVLASRPSTEDAFTIRAPLFLDCSGDGRLGAEAGAEYRVGREAQSEFGESMAPPVADRKTMGSSILFIGRKYDRPMPFKPPAWAHKFAGPLPHRGIGSYEYGFWWNEWGGELDIIKDNERIRDELLATALGIWDLIKNSGHYPDSENWALEWVGAVPGKRESRRFIGDYILREQDVKNGEVFEDGVAYGGWPIDLHPPAGIHCEEPPAVSVNTPLYNIPFRCVYSRNITNLLFAGRNVSTSHVAFGSTRVMGTCAVLGQAAGTAVALCIKHQCAPRELGKEGIQELQQQLLKDDAYIIGVTNRDPYDLARKSAVTASSAMPDGRGAENVINGIHRGVGPRANRWSSDPNAGMPQWLMLNFPAAQKIREVHLVFDTGLNRQLTLTHSESAHRYQVWGPQTETVKDYELQVLHGESAETVAKVEGNYQRKRVHRFDAREATGLRLVIHATNGAASANVFEIRAYG